jgi:diguanylate cyclase (GGDEF)-like protein
METPTAHTIVIANDSRFYTRLLKASLEGQYRTLLAKDGREALALVAENRPEVLLTDWEMPDISGVELCRRIHSDQDWYTHAILLTSNDQKEQIMAGLAAGANDYLVKPFHAGELIARVNVGIRIAELHREIQTKNRLLEELALTDNLTDLPNRRALEHWADRAFVAAKRHNFPFWAVIGDIDLFKNINDTFGHQAGDDILREFGKVIKSRTRASDMCARFGGEEFVLGLSHIDRTGVEIAIERMRVEVQNHAFRSEGQSVAVTASFGIAGISGCVRDFAELLRQADTALYQAKRLGRNRIEFYELTSPAAATNLSKDLPLL